MIPLITPDSWLVFDLLGLTGSQDWMTIPVSFWDHFEDFRKFREFVENISVCNDIAERGVALITAYQLAWPNPNLPAQPNKTESQLRPRLLLHLRWVCMSVCLSARQG